MKISILGDSISTYEGYNPRKYAVYYDKGIKIQNHLDDVSKTWWHQVISWMGGTLCVNDSYSGSKVSGDGFPSGCSAERIGNLGDPDVVLVYLGMNDYGYCVSVRGKEEHAEEEAKSFFAPAYESMLSCIRERWPNAKVFCGTLLMARMKEYDEWKFPQNYHGNRFEDYNDAIRNACKITGCTLVDLAALGVRYQSLDGTHPDDVGHGEIADAWILCLWDLLAKP